MNSAALGTRFQTWNRYDVEICVDLQSKHFPSTVLERGEIMLNDPTGSMVHAHELSWIFFRKQCIDEMRIKYMSTYSPGKWNTQSAVAVAAARRWLIKNGRHVDNDSVGWESCSHKTKLCNISAIFGLSWQGNRSIRWHPVAGSRENPVAVCNWKFTCFPSILLKTFC